jgi:leader peptidase (prepilin peptidase)/N-methyltransferase
MAIGIIPAAVLGAIVGSFLNVVAWRLPRGESLVKPGSRCPSCETPIRPYDNVPVLSWLALRGRCRSCKASIPVRYPLVELATGVLCAAIVATHWDDPTQAVLGVTLVLFLVPIVMIDLERQIIPNALTGPAAVLAVLLGLALDSGFVPEQLIAGACAGAFFLAAALAYPRGMGMGDVKLAAVMGLYLGRAVAPAIFIALISGVLAGLVVMARLGVAEGRRTRVPFGPFLALGSVVAIFVGDQLVDAYVNG